MIFSIFVSICLLPLVTAKVWDVQVGGADLLFNPEAIVRPLIPITPRRLG
jgi:hypothetical protein